VIERCGPGPVICPRPCLHRDEIQNTSVTRLDYRWHRLDLDTGTGAGTSHDGFVLFPSPPTTYMRDICDRRMKSILPRENRPSIAQPYPTCSPASLNPAFQQRLALNHHTQPVSVPCRVSGPFPTPTKPTTSRTLTSHPDRPKFQ
jgi:hypothetical protein